MTVHQRQPHRRPRRRPRRTERALFPLRSRLPVLGPPTAAAGLDHNPAAAPVSSGHRVVQHSGQRSASPACRCWVGHQSSTEFNKAMKHVLSVLVIVASLAVAASGRVQVQPGASPLRRHRPRLPRRIRSVPRCRRLCDARRACRPVRISHHQHKIGLLEHRGEHLATGNAIPAINPRGPRLQRPLGKYCPGLLLTPRWREMDSNLRFPNRSAPVFETAVPSPMTV